MAGAGRSSQALTTEFRVLSWQQEGLREDVKSLEPMRMLHSNDVFIQSVLPGEFIRPKNHKGIPISVTQTQVFQCDHILSSSYILHSSRAVTKDSNVSQSISLSTPKVY